MTSVDIQRALAATPRRSFPLRLWDGNPTVPAVYVATPHDDGRPGYSLRRYRPEDDARAAVIDGLLDGVHSVAKALA